MPRRIVVDVVAYHLNLGMLTIVGPAVGSFCVFALSPSTLGGDVPAIGGDVPAIGGDVHPGVPAVGGDVHSGLPDLPKNDSADECLLEPDIDGDMLGHGKGIRSFGWPSGSRCRKMCSRIQPPALLQDPASNLDALQY